MSDNQIHLKGEYRHDEGIASGTVKPGHLLERTTATANTVKAHATEAGYAERLVAVEDALQGNEITDDYSAGDKVMYHICEPGCEVQMWIKAGEDIAIGDELISAGDGTLIENGSETSGTTVRQVIAVAMEAKDLSASGAVNTLADVRIV